MTHSFVIPVHGESRYLRECLKSLKNQSHPGKIILSTAEDSEFIRKISREFDVPYVVNNNGGQIGKDWNFALKIADTDLVTIAHQDDVYIKDYTQRVLDAFRENPDAAISFTDYHEIRDDKVVSDNLNLKIKKLLLWPKKKLNSHLTQTIAIMFGCAICCPSVTYNKKKLGDFKFSEELKSNLDWMAWAGLNKDGEEFIYIPESLTLHRIHAESETTNQIKQHQRQNEDVVVLRQFWPRPIASLIEVLYKNSEKRNS